MLEMAESLRICECLPHFQYGKGEKFRLPDSSAAKTPGAGMTFRGQFSPIAALYDSQGDAIELHFHVPSEFPRQFSNASRRVRTREFRSEA